MLVRRKMADENTYFFSALAELAALVQKVYTETFFLAEMTSDVAVLFMTITHKIP